MQVTSSARAFFLVTDSTKVVMRYSFSDKDHLASTWRSAPRGSTLFRTPCVAARPEPACGDRQHFINAACERYGRRRAPLSRRRSFEFRCTSRKEDTGDECPRDFNRFKHGASLEQNVC